ncbi:unnamed protein product [Miscanthus lutarioriparius]|uniref:Uncharacterized protein n=1 Tax=Miscanthus lutarioriparius TaxID=422564 RepID=A0A811NDK7_9POAL|nr:unnamed protein product [Miscanthus lutarioriparius]
MTAGVRTGGRRVRVERERERALGRERRATGRVEIFPDGLRRRSWSIYLIEWIWMGSRSRTGNRTGTKFRDDVETWTVVPLEEQARLVWLNFGTTWTVIPLEEQARLVWLNEYDEGGARHGIMTTNSFEVYNWMLRGVRGLPLVGIVEFYLYRTIKYFMERYAVADQSIMADP